MARDEETHVVQYGHEVSSTDVICGPLSLHHDTTGVHGGRRRRRRRRGRQALRCWRPRSHRPRRTWRSIGAGDNRVPVSVDHAADHTLQPLEAGGHALGGAAGLLGARRVCAGVRPPPLGALPTGGRAVALELRAPAGRAREEHARALGVLLLLLLLLRQWICLMLL